MIRHHLSHATLTAYALGTLPEALALAAATHIGQCRTCSVQVADIEHKGGLDIDQTDPVPLRDGAWTEILARLEQDVPPAPLALNPGLPAPLDRVHFGRSWSLGFGFRWRAMQTGGAAWGGLLLVRPGWALPRHGHSGLELTCVLSGAFSDQGRVFTAGDIAEEVGEHPSALWVVGKQPCLCLVANEGLMFAGRLGRLQRWLGRKREPPNMHVTKQCLHFQERPMPRQPAA